MSVIAALVVGPTERERLMDALRGVATVRFCGAAAELSTLIRPGNVSLLLSELLDSTAESTAPALRAVATQYPSIPVVLYAPLTPESARAAFALGAVGIADVVFRGVDDVGQVLGPLLARALASRASARIIRIIEPLAPANVSHVLTYCALHAVGHLTAKDVVAALGVEPRTLNQQLRRAGIPSLRHIIAWNRILHASWLLQDVGRTVEEVAAQLDFASASDLSHRCHRYTGLWPSEIRACGGLEVLLPAYLRALLGARAVSVAA